MNEHRNSVPEREEIRFTSARRGGSTLELFYSCWTDHEGTTIKLSSNGKALHIAVSPFEVPGLIEALTKLRDERGWTK
jgi:hypothetical protein